MHGRCKQDISGEVKHVLTQMHHMQVADEYLRGVLNAAALEGNTSDIPDLRALIRSGERANMAAAGWQDEAVPHAGTGAEDACASHACRQGRCGQHALVGHI